MVDIYKDLMVYELDHQTKLISTRWIRSLNSKEYRQAMLFIQATIDAHNLTYWLYDASRYSSPNISDQHWMADVFSPLMNKTTIRKVAALLPNDIFLQTVAENIHKRTKHSNRNGATFETFFDMTDAKEWLFSED